MSAAADINSQEVSSKSGAKKWRRMKAALHIESGSIDDASVHMLNLYRTNLDVRLRMIDEASLKSDTQKKLYATVIQMLTGPIKPSMRSRNIEWDEIYKAESLIALLYSGAQLQHEISTRLQELAVENLAEANALRRDYEDKPPGADKAATPDDATLRAFLLRVMEAIHWSAKKKYLARPIRKEATNRILVGMLFSFLLLVAPYAYLIFDFKPHNADSVNKIWSLFALWTALTAGLLGAFFSRLISIQRQWANMTLDEVFLHREWAYTLLRAGVGVCGAVIVYFFLRSGIAEGALFPDFNKVMIEFVNVPGQTQVDAVHMAFVMPSKALALLTFWCFLAGFSEVLVPSILSNTERQLADAATQAQTSRK